MFASASTVLTRPSRGPGLLLAGIGAVLLPVSGLHASAGTGDAASESAASESTASESFVSAATSPAAQDIAGAAAPAMRPIGSGSASYYASRFEGRRTANGERYSGEAFTAAHRSLPFGSIVRVTNRANGRSVTVRINDRGPFTAGRVIDVSRAAALELGLIAPGHAPVELELIEG